MRSGLLNGVEYPTHFVTARRPRRREQTCVMATDNPLHNLMDIICNLADAYTAALFVLQPDAETLTLRVHQSLSPQIKIDASFKIGQGLLGRAAFDLKPLVKDFSQEAAPKLELYRRKEDLKSLWVIPLMDDDALKGILYIDSKEQYRVPTKVQKMMTPLTSQLLWHLEQETAPVSFAGEPADFAALLKWCRFLAESPDLRALSERFVHIPKNIMQMDALAVVWFDENGDGRLAASRGWGAGLKDLPLELGTGICGQAAKSGSPVLIGDTRNRPFVLFAKNENVGAFSSILAVPINFRRDPAGVVLCATQRVGGLQPVDLGRLLWMTTFALQSPALGAQEREDPPARRYLHTPHFAAVQSVSVEDEIFSPDRTISMLSIHFTNLDGLARKQGFEASETILNEAATRLAPVLPQPKLLFKAGETTLAALLVNVDGEQALALEPEILQALGEPVFSSGDTLYRPDLEFGISAYPEDGDHLTALLVSSLTRIAPTGDNVHA
ncbi:MULTISPECIES: GAF domain-containing protein [unclassified Nitrospina]|uniref:GAF domain-containing protein n=1 Tax=unclassified Nitrospina TaxID=2638683 RepID=UPI003F9BCE69